MQFNSYIFILVFMPLTTTLYYLANRIGATAGKLVIIAASVVSVCYVGGVTAIVLPVSMLINYAFARAMTFRRQDRTAGKCRRAGISRFLLICPVIINVGLLLYFKYANFFISTVGVVTGRSVTLRDIALPVGISFFTFQQIAYLVWASRGERLSLIDYAAYILYFPKLLMGPLMEPEDFFTQINDPARKTFSCENMASGVKIFSLGLFKKMLIADTFAAAVSWGYSNIDTATGLDLLVVMLSYTFEIYFDFSGYSDMATGASQMLGIALPMNFDSPYKALSIRDFWKRWHMSLTAFFTKYVYIPLGGSRRGRLATYVNTMIVFLISGLWHDANWTFILWGACHGLLMVLERMLGDDGEASRVKAPGNAKPFDAGNKPDDVGMLSRSGDAEPAGLTKDPGNKKRRFTWRFTNLLRWAVTFGLVNVLWLLFSAESLPQWLEMLRRIVTMAGVNLRGSLSGDLSSAINGVAGALSLGLLDTFYVMEIKYSLGVLLGPAARYISPLIWLGLALGICIIPDNAFRTRNRLSTAGALGAALLFLWALFSLSGDSTFVYYGF